MTKKTVSDLGVIAVKGGTPPRPDAPATLPAKSAPKGKPEHRVLMSYRPKSDVYEQLREISHRDRVPMQSLIDTAVEAWLETYEA
jgi:hypothetical protein